MSNDNNNSNNGSEMNIEDIYSDDDNLDCSEYGEYEDDHNEDDHNEDDHNEDDHNEDDHNGLQIFPTNNDINPNINANITIDSLFNNYNINGLLDLITNDISNTYSMELAESAENAYNTLDNILNSTFYDTPKYKNILSEKGENELKIIKFSKELGVNTSCPINQIDFVEEMDVIQLPCNHCFNIEGINKWLKTEKAICPVCRYELDSVEKKVKEEEPSIQNRIQSRRISFHNLIDTVIEEQNEENLQMAIINSLYEGRNPQP